MFYDSLGIPYDYELEGFDLNGLWYLPDFWLPNQDCWVEIKATEPTEGEYEKAARLAAASEKTVFIFYGAIDRQAEAALSGFESSAVWIDPTSLEYGGCDYGWLWHECQHCGAFGIHYSYHDERMACKTRGACPDNDRWRSERLPKAITAALSERFGS